MGMDDYMGFVAGDLSMAERLAGELLSLTFDSHFTAELQDYVINVLILLKR